MTQSVVDIVVRAKGQGELARLQGRLTELEAKVNKLQGQMPKAANGIRAFGRGAAGASAGVRTLGAAVQAALGPIALLGGAVGAISGAFKTLADQDFAEAKVRTLGVNSEQLKKNLTDLSRELQGQRSVVELTAASYDVASAGFNSAAEATKVLKAASLGATGGFSDLNTVANATTSVLNAYGLEASAATKLVDQFVQTQNDGKIVVAEYAREIGKVASVAAGLKVPLEEVNAVIAQATASGVKSEVAFTGLKTALAQLASGQATERMKDLGISIDANSIAADGLLGTFKKIKESGADMGQVLKLLGTEAGPALAPVLNNLERYEELLNNQKGANGVAAAAAKEASETIVGAWTRLSTAVQNLFADQTELGEVLRVTLLAAAGFVEGLAAAFKTLMAPVRAFISILGGVAKGLGLINDKTDVIRGLTDLWFEAIEAAQTFADVIVFTGERIGNAVGGKIAEVRGWFQGLWDSITGGVQGVASAIPDAFQDAFDKAWDLIQRFWNMLPGWLRGALSAAGSVVGGVAGAVSDAIGSVVGQVQGAIQNEIEYTLKNAKGSAGNILGNKLKQAQQSTSSSSSSSGGGGGGGGKTSQVPNLQAELALKKELYKIEDQIRAARAADDQSEVARLQGLKIKANLQGEIARIRLQDIGAAEKQLRIQLAELAASDKLKQISDGEAQREQKRLQTLDSMMLKFDREVELSGLKTEEARKLMEIEYEILDLKEKGILKTQQEIEQYRQKAKAASEAANPGKIQKYLQDTSDWLNDTEGRVVDLANSMEGHLAEAFGSVIDGSKSTGEAFRDMFKGIAKSFLQMATQMIAKMIIMSILNKALGGILGGGGLDYSGGAATDAFLPGTKGIGGFFAEGGRPPVGRPSVVGENGPELFVPSSSGTIVPNDAMGGEVNSVVNVTINGDGTSQTDASRATKLGRMVEASVMGVLNRERRPGGVLSR